MTLKDCDVGEKHYVCRGHYGKQMKCCICMGFTGLECIEVSNPEFGEHLERLKKEVEDEREMNRWIKRDEGERI